MDMTAADALTATVATVLQEVPDAAGVLVNRGLACAGCPFSRFDTIADVAAVYGFDGVELARAMLASVTAGAWGRDRGEQS